MPNVSIIIVNYNGRDLVRDCLKALERQSFKDFEVLIIDNASSDISLDEIERFLKASPLSFSVKLIPLNTNVGFSGGNLEGLKHANGEFVALLNNDADPDKEWLGELVKTMDNDSTVGICASKLIACGTNIIDSAGDAYSTSLKGFKRGEGEEAHLYNKREYIFGACAGAALYRRKMIEKIGFFDEDFFLIHEDTDLNFRAQLNGWKVFYVPTAIVYHKVRSTIGRMSKTAVYYTLRNSEFVRIKNVSFSLFLRFLPEFKLGILSEFIYFALKHAHPVLYFKAKIDAMRLLPVMLKKRSINMKAKKVSSKDLREIMTPILEYSFLKNKLRKFIFE